MNRYSRIIHHIDMEDVKLKCLDEIAAREIEEKNRKFEEEYIAKKMESWGYDWRKEISEQMTTSSMMYTVLSPEGDEALDTISAASHYSVLDGSSVQSSGSGTGGDGGFNVGQDYLNVGDASNDSVILKDIDTRQIDTITFSVIIGNGSNGGAPPDGNLGVYVQSAGTAANPTGGYGTLATWTPWYTPADAANDPNYNSKLNFTSIIATPSDVGDGSVQDFSVKIPPWHQRENARFALNVEYGSGIQYGIVAIKLQRKTPMTLWVGLDDPEASSFIRVGQGSGTTSPKKRKKRVQDILVSGDKYTTTSMGPDFPGSGARLDDPQMPDKQVADIQQANRNTIGDRVQSNWMPIKSDEVKTSDNETRKIAQILSNTSSSQKQQIEATKAIIPIFQKNIGVQTEKIISEIEQGKNVKPPNVLSDSDKKKWNYNTTSNDDRMETISMYATATQTFLKYLAGDNRTITNKSVPSSYVSFVEKNLKINEEGKIDLLGSKDALIGTGQEPIFKNGKIQATATLDFKTNIEEFKTHYSRLLNKKGEMVIQPGIRTKWGYELAKLTQRFLPDLNYMYDADVPGIPSKLDAIIASKMISSAKILGGGKPIPISLDLDPRNLSSDTYGELVRNGTIPLADAIKFADHSQLIEVSSAMRTLKKEARKKLENSYRAEQEAVYAELNRLQKLHKTKRQYWTRPETEEERIARMKRGGFVGYSEKWGQGKWTHGAGGVVTMGDSTPEWKAAQEAIEEFRLKKDKLYKEFYEEWEAKRDLIDNLMNSNEIFIDGKRVEDLPDVDYSIFGELTPITPESPAPIRKGQGGLPLGTTTKRADVAYGKPTTSKTKRQSLSLDEPIVRDKKKKRKTRYSSGVQSENKVTESVSMKKKLKTAKEFFKQADIKPTFPENPPPERVNGWHPEYGKQAGRYKKLDPVSAKSMPKTGDTEIDAEVEKAKKKSK